jgi:hypothetical protein
VHALGAEVTARASANRVAIEASVDDREGQWRLDDRVIGVHNVFRRLAMPDGPHCVHVLERIRIMKEAGVERTEPLGGLPGDQAALLDCVLAAPDYERGFVKVLYWQGGSIRVKAERLGCGQTKFNKERNAVLSYFRGQMHGRGFRV